MDKTMTEPTAGVGTGRGEHGDRLRALERGHDVLTHQMAEIVVEMREAVAAGMREALTDPEVLAGMWDAAMTRAQQAAAASTGRWVLGSIKAFFNKWLVIAVIVVLLGQYIGWPAAMKVLAGIVKGDS